MKESPHDLTVEELKDTQYPDCYSRCGIVLILGVGECESVCQNKFKLGGR